MIEPIDADVGRLVVYQPIRGPAEEGVITSFNKSYVFVRFRGDNHSKATRREDLEWSAP